MQNSDFNLKVKEILSRFGFIHSVIVANSQDGVEVFESTPNPEATKDLLNKELGGLPALRHTISDIFSTILQ